MPKGTAVSADKARPLPKWMLKKTEELTPRELRWKIAALEREQKQVDRLVARAVELLQDAMP